MKKGLSNTYKEYKNSEIHWLGKIPKHWEVRRVKDLAEYQSGEYINANEFDEANIYPVYGGNGFRGFSEKYNTNGDYILIGRQGALCGNINYAKGKFWATEHAVVVYKKKNINTEWFGEFLRVMNLNQYALATAQPGLSVEKIKRVELVLPSFEEQNEIGKFINHYTNIIDKKVSLLETKVGYYKALCKTLIHETVCRGLNKNVPLKESDIAWIGEIPKHWAVKRFKEVCYRNHTGGTPQTTSRQHFEGHNVWITISDIDDTKFVGNTSKLKLTNEAIQEANIPISPKGSLLYSFKLTLGKIAFTTQDLYTNEAIISILPNRKIDLRYCYYMLPIFLLLNASENIYGAKMLNQRQIGNALLTVPPVEEQTAIADYLDNKTNTIDAILTNITKQIEGLKELRKTLINDVVTGKLKVTE